MKEVWKDVLGYEGLYQVSNLGRIKSLPRHTTRGKIRKLIPQRSGYLMFPAWKNGKLKLLSVHRCVAKAFIPNPKNLPQVNHKDECKTNNCVSNLEWCSAKYNTNYGTGHMRATYSESKSVLQLTLDGELVKRWLSATEAGQHGFGEGNVANCCRGKLATAYGYKWQFAKVGD